MRPNTNRIFNRALVLSCVVGRGLIEGISNLDSREAVRKDILDWFNQMDLSGEAEEQELQLLQTKIGNLDKQAAINAGWKCEGITVLLWSLGLYNLLPFYEQVNDPRELVSLVGFMENQKAFFINSIKKPVSINDVDRFAEHIFNVHWRLRDYRTRNNAFYNCSNLFSEDIINPIINTEVFSLINNDLNINGSQISHSDPKLIQIAISIVHERHQAANWLIGDAELYSKISCDT